MKDSGSLIFPFKWDNENECMLRAFTVENTVVSAIRVFLVTRKGSRLGSNLGSFLPELLLQGIASSKLTELASQLKTELQSQFSGVSFLEVLFTRVLNDKTSTLNVSIKLMVPTNSQIIELDFNLPSIFTI